MANNLKKNLLYYWRINLAVVLGAAIAAAVLTGALLVGDSVRGSLRDMTLERLGDIDYALVSERFFRAALAEDLMQSPRFRDLFYRAAPAILLSGSAVAPQNKARASQVEITGLDQRFLQLFDSNPLLPSMRLDSLLQKPAGQPFPPVVINAALQRELQLQVGDPLLLYLARRSEIHRESLFGSKQTEDIVRTLRLTVSAVLPDRGMGRFGLRPHQTLPLNAFVSLEVLQKALEQSGRVNSLMVAAVRPQTGHSAVLQDEFHQALQLDDAGLKLVVRENFLSLESREFVLSPPVADAALAAAAAADAVVLPVLTYLANSTRREGRVMPYATVAALPSELPEDFGKLRLLNGSPAPPLHGSQILLNRWAAEDLAASAGDTLTMRYYRVEGGEALAETSHVFQVAGVVRLEGLGADPSLTPDFPGIHDAEHIYDWDPPFPVDLSRVRPKDEQYWDDHRATPKAFIVLETGQQLWGSRFGKLTAIRMAAPGGGDLHRLAETVTSELRQRLHPAMLDLRFQPVKQQGLSAATGATDFSGLFIGFSLFLIVSAALLTGLLFRLGVEQRVGEIGVLLSTGYPPKKIRRQFLGEGLLLAALGCLLGLLLALGYAWLVMAALRTWWSQATGTSFLFLHVTPLSLVLGYLIALLVVILAITRTLRQLKQVPAPALLAGVTAVSRDGSGRAALWLALGALAAALLMIGYALTAGVTASAGLFFGSGALLLIAGLSLVAAFFRRPRRQSGGLRGLIAMALLNNARKPGRSMLCVALVACAAFMIVSVGANRTDFRRLAVERTSGTGGYALLAEADIPLYSDLNTPAGRLDLGFPSSGPLESDSGYIASLRLLPGEDASCLNLYRPEKPRVLGVPPAMIRRGGFGFQALPEMHPANPWELLEDTLAPGVIPALADYNSAMWIMHLQRGEDLVMEDQFGDTLRLRLVGLLEKSIFQSEVLISETNFLKHFPGQGGYRYFLIDVPGSKAGEVTLSLERTLSDYGFDVTPTGEKLAAYQAVENTYLSVFQTLGGLGLLLGTFGLGLILFRNALERKGELAVMRAFGYRQQVIARLLLLENSLLILLGLLIGSLAALIAVAPHVLSQAGQAPWLSLGLTLLLVFATGLLASLLAVFAALRQPLLPALKAE